ncbi:MAG: type II toxin-antitoxin system VapC family toxin [Thermodesulfobacteriota bacterium]
MKVFVPDASVILKWVLGETENQDKAIELLEGWLNQEYEFILPPLWLYEVGNVLGLKREKDAEKILGLLLEYEFRECKITGELVNSTFGLMREFKGVTFYDAIYHAVALLENGVMVTADKAYFEKAKDKGNIILI